MKTILVPIDFSESSDNAAAYAVALAKEIQAGILLFHAYHIPIPTAEMQSMVFPPPEFEKGNQERMDLYRSSLQEHAPKGVRIEARTTPGLAAEEIGDVLKKEDIDLVVMGISVSEKVEHALLGSVTTKVLRDSAPKPLLIVPSTARFKGLKTIALSLDYEKSPGPAVLAKLKELLRLFQSKLLVVHVGAFKTPEGDPAPEPEIQLENQLGDIEHTVHFVNSLDVVESLDKFSQEHQADLLIMIPRHHSLLGRIFHSSHTRKMVFHTHVPILALHE